MTNTSADKVRLVHTVPWFLIGRDENTFSGGAAALGKCFGQDGTSGPTAVCKKGCWGQTVCFDSKFLEWVSNCTFTLYGTRPSLPLVNNRILQKQVTLGTTRYTVSLFGRPAIK